jgi:hypothetical protein
LAHLGELDERDDGSALSPDMSDSRTFMSIAQ